MAKIRAVDFANYVESSKNLAVFVANSKNISASSKDNLKSVINKFNQLESVEEPEHYVADPYYDNLEQEYLNDPLRQKNGGEYLYCNYYILTAEDAMTQINSRSITGNNTTPTLAITSDGQQFIGTSTGTTETYTKMITWTEGHYDGILQDGTKVRWIKTYTSYPNKQYPIRGTNDTNWSVPDYSGATIAAIIDNNCELSGNSGSVSYSFVDSNLKYLILGDEVIEWAGGYLDGCIMDCIKNLSSGISGIRLLGHSITPRHLGYLDLNIIQLYSLNVSSTTTRSNFYGLKRLDLSNTVIGIPNSTNTKKSQFSTYFTEKIYFPAECEHFSGFGNLNDKFTTFAIPVITSEQIEPVELSCYNLINLSIPENFNVPLDLRDCYTLSKESALNIFNNIADLTNSESKTIVLYNRLENMLSDEEKAIATNKNWTLSFRYN